MNLHITPQTVLIQGQPTEAAGVEGYFLYLAPFSISLLGTGKMPVPQENLLFVERASCPFLRIMQDVNYFLPSGFQTLIPLPHRVHPETYGTEIHSDGLTIQLAKELRVPPSQVRIQLSNTHL
ncbi:hypothetical protein QUA56_12270 [Microcoleus sp. N3A4]